MNASAGQGDEGAVGLFDRWLWLASLLFGLQGLAWVAIGSFDPFGVWDGLLANAFYEGSTPAEVERFRRFLLGPFGATLAGYFLLINRIVRHPFRRREPWALRAVTGAIWLWFVVDSTASLWHGALFNVLLVNLPCVVVMTIPLVALRREFANGVESAAA